MIFKKVLAVLLCLLLSAAAVGSAAAEDVNLLERLGETVAKVMADLAGTPGDTAEVADWIGLKLAALQGKTDIVVTADITYGDGQGTIVFSKPITLRSQEGGNYWIDGNGKQILCVQGASADETMDGLTVVENLTFRGGDATTTYADIYGTGSGGALFVMGDLKLSGCAFSANNANYGAAVCANGGVILDNCTVDGSVAAVAGAVYALNGDIVMTGGSLTGNLARWYGGGLYAYYGNILLTDATVTSNAAESGGGVYAQYGNVEIAGAAVLSGNTAGTSGGAVYVESGIFSQTGGMIESNSASYGAVFLGSGSGTFSGGAIRNNTAQFGGGVFAQTAEVLFGEGFSMEGNSVQVSGGAVYIQEGKATVAGAAFTGNTAAYGGAMYINVGQVLVTSGILKQNSAEYGGALYLTGGDITVSGGVLRGNTATASGGAIYNDSGTVAIEGGKIWNNTAAYGGGALTLSGSIRVSGGAIFSNQAQYGGALYVTTGEIQVTGGRVTGNTAAVSGGGVYSEGGAVTDEKGVVYGNSPDNMGRP